ncbi:hypothetical protein Aduo_019221 [Ancylostoma duodenale]
MLKNEGMSVRPYCCTNCTLPHPWKLTVNTMMLSEFLFRYYYNTKILLPVSGRRLVYKFGPSARGWSSHEPILYAGYSSTAYSSDEEEATSGENMSTYSSFDVEYPIKYRELPV